MSSSRIQNRGLLTGLAAAWAIDIQGCARRPLISWAGAAAAEKTRLNGHLMTYHKQDDWLPLVGEAVQIRQYGQFVGAGVVDAVTDDDGILWLAADGVNQRRLITRADGFEVWMTYKWETAGARR
ncbi:hypothetical protein [Arthrobacter sp. Bi83]|uniref:hypothetical protein n=1 Tax=Arthrobacter sp. Bi83 TaxID=2822353 RepID=UPI001E490A63|nr:hypothetical protein [Arthrobacter sp. Bi83]